MISFSSRIMNQIVRGYISSPKIKPNKTVSITFRCWPIDIDAFLHMNNSKYLQVAELSRWRTLPPSSILSRVFSKEGLLFLAVENHIQYMRPIKPFQRYIVSTSVSFEANDDKWINYRHVFEEHDDDVVCDKPKTFAIVDLKAVVKEGNGKTVKPSTIVKDSKFFERWVSIVT
mmetsp:Transcript_12809/g.14458  ORF Transcript_12809/g.14458 Transcript_12809/m.14458 type:complete len:173 (+) Transcript_12809:140-658(+)